MYYSRFASTVCLTAVLATTILAQAPSDVVERISNWPAPLYWQPAAPASERSPVYRHSVEREAASSAPGRLAGVNLGNLAVFVAMAPCRVVDTRNPVSTFGGPAFAAGEIRTIPMPSSPTCSIPVNAEAYSLNIAVVPVGTTMRWLTAWNTGAAQPLASTLNDRAGLVTSNSAVVPAGTNGAINIYVTDPTDVVIDINGYYAPQTIGTSTSMGLGAFATGTGTDDTAVGYHALMSNTTGVSNTALGFQALLSNTAGSSNTAFGWSAAALNTGGMDNTALGNYALYNNVGGSNNTALGDASLFNMSGGSFNIGVGQAAGSGLVGGSYNIMIGNEGTGVDSGVIRIGVSPRQTRAFIQGIRGVTTGVNDALPVVIDSTGQLGTANSARRFKRDIQDMGDTTSTIMGLRPVEFRYTVHGGQGPMQYGLIAEEVAGVSSDLVARNANGEIQTVYYDKVNAMLLNQVQKQERLIEKLESRIEDLENRLK